ncbi:MAG TPA: EF-hand domain-containing protein [Phycisphaerales bacterium]|nr:EF-hand domain-containing protein [Phycisphaerae bacterium]HRJ49171.1 EF-hand domain-containing protein [Phycisphaerales bacterium]
MSSRMNHVQVLLSALVIGSTALLAAGGPRDNSTNYPVGIGIGGTEIAGIADTGGTTTISFEDAKKLGILDANGDPVNPPDGTTTLNGTGGGSVKCHRYDSLKIKIQPKNADGSNNGPAREIEATVLIAKKPADQDGANDAEKERKTKSVTNKLGKNVCGAVIDGKKLDYADRATKDPKKNERGTRWIDAPVEDRAEVPFDEDPDPTDDVHIPCSTPVAILNGVPIPGALVSTVSASLIPTPLAMQIGAELVGTELLTVETQMALFAEGLLPMLPENHPIPMQVVAIQTCLPLVGGGLFCNPSPAYFLTAPFVQRLLLGSNSLVPENWAATFNSQTGTIQFAPLCLADFDGSGFVDLDDFAAFVLAFEEGIDQADFDRSGFVDLDDFVGFVHAFEEGC